MASDLNIFSEHPERDITRYLERYTYEAAITQSTREPRRPLDQVAREEITCAIRQGIEYMHAARSSSLSTAPVQIYYGLISLLRGAVILAYGTQEMIDHHGMYIGDIAPNTIGDIAMICTGKERGGLQIFGRAIGTSLHAMQGGQRWLFKDIIGSLPDMIEWHRVCYLKDRRFCVPVQRLVGNDRSVVDRMEYEQHKLEIESIISSKSWATTYLEPQHVSPNYVMLRRRLGVTIDVTLQDLKGRRYLQVPHIVKGHSFFIPEIFSFVSGLFILATLSRYHPVTWNRFVRTSSSMESHLLQVFCDLGIRKMPNLLLNMIEGRQLIFSNERETVVDMRKFATRAEAEEIAANEAKRVLDSFRQGDM